jgi:hypothetical protein
MRGIALATALLILTADIAIAGEANTTDEACSTAGATAALIMKMRQNGTSLDDMMKFVRDGADATIKDAVRAITMQAYSKPRFETEMMQRRAIDDFRDYVQLACLKAAG